MKFLVVALLVGAVYASGNGCIRNRGWSYCKTSSKCSHGYGDCDKNSECKRGLTCVSSKKGQSIGGWAYDCCRCPAKGGWHSCFTNCKCKHSQGDCDSNSQCVAGTSCRTSADKPQPLSGRAMDFCCYNVGGWHACDSKNCKCGSGEGDCDDTKQCKSGLTCRSSVQGQHVDGRAKDYCCPTANGVGTKCTSKCVCAKGLKCSKSGKCTAPTKPPTKMPTKMPTKSPTKAPTKEPTKSPTKAPTKAPTKEPTKSPTKAPTKEPTKSPTKAPTKSPTKAPTAVTYTKYNTNGQCADKNGKKYDRYWADQITTAECEKACTDKAGCRGFMRLVGGWGSTRCLIQFDNNKTPAQSGSTIAGKSVTGRYVGYTGVGLVMKVASQSNVVCYGASVLTFGEDDEDEDLGNGIHPEDLGNGIPPSEMEINGIGFRRAMTTDGTVVDAAEDDTENDASQVEDEDQTEGEAMEAEPVDDVTLDGSEVELEGEMMDELEE